MAKAWVFRLKSDNFYCLEEYGPRISTRRPRIELMGVPLIERGDYYRGLLVLIRRDRVIRVQERELMIQLGQALDFDKRFCERAMDDLLKNPHSKDAPMKFSSRETAENFMRDAIMLALVDGELHPKELSWLKAVANANSLKDEMIWLCI
jgi:hypothetical protein